MAKNNSGFGKTPAKENSMLGNPGAQGSVSFGGSFKQESSNLRPGKLAMKQSIANPKNAPVRTNGNAPGNPYVCFDKGVKKPKPAKNRAGFTTSD